MADIIRVSIDIKKIAEEFLYKGAKGTYLDITLLPTKDAGGVDRYGNTHMAVQGVSKTAREAGKKGPILGNAKIMWSGGQQGAPQAQRPAQPDNGGDMGDGGPDPF